MRTCLLVASWAMAGIKPSAFHWMSVEGIVICTSCDFFVRISVTWKGLFYKGMGGVLVCDFFHYCLSFYYV